MRAGCNPIALLAAAALGFAAAHFGLPADGEPISASVAQDQPDEEEVSPAAQAMIRASRPSERHRNLDQLVGEWDAQFRMWAEPGAPPMTARGTISREWVLGGRYVKETVEAETAIGSETFHGLGFIGYNNFDQQYEAVWMDSASTAIHMEEGTYHPYKKILHMRGPRRDPVTGRVIDSWGKMDMSDPDRHVYLTYTNDLDGHTYTSFEGVAVRKQGPP